MLAWRYKHHFQYLSFTSRLNLRKFKFFTVEAIDCNLYGSPDIVSLHWIKQFPFSLVILLFLQFNVTSQINTTTGGLRYLIQQRSTHGFLLINDSDPAVGDRILATPDQPFYWDIDMIPGIAGFTGIVT